MIRVRYDRMAVGDGDGVGVGYRRECLLKNINIRYKHKHHLRFAHVKTNFPTLAS
jgi:hypothetical protein